jgi:hypothetical protein
MEESRRHQTKLELDCGVSKPAGFPDTLIFNLLVKLPLCSQEQEKDAGNIKKRTRCLIFQGILSGRHGFFGGSGIGPTKLRKQGYTLQGGLCAWTGH